MYYQNQPSDQPPPYTPNFIPPPMVDERAPLTPPRERRNSDVKFAASEWRDLPFSILFVLHLFGFIALFVISAFKYKNSNTNTNNEIYTPTDWGNVRSFIGICCACAAFSLIVSFTYITIIKKFARQVIIGTIIASVLFWIISAVFVMTQGLYIYGGILLLFAFINAFFFFLWRSRIPFATTVLKTVASVIEQYPGSTYIAYASYLVQFLFVFLWACCVVFAQSFPQTIMIVISIFLLFSFYWTSQVIKNTIHVTTSGAVATWYFMRGTGMPHNPTLASFRRTVTTSFGSVCLGSLLVALLQTLRAILRGIKGRVGSLIAAILDCILGLIESLFQYFNRYAFAQVAIYGKTYCRAAKDTWELVKSHGVEAIINDNLIGGVLSMGALLGGLMTGVLGGVLGALILEKYWISCAVAGFVIGFTFVLLTMEVVDSGVCTIFVSFAMDPAVLRNTDPELYAKFRERYGQYESMWL